MPKSVLEAIKQGFWDFEPTVVESNDFEAADAMPGTKEKLEIMAQRVQHGLPLWNVHDRNDVESPAPRKPKRRPR